MKHHAFFSAIIRTFTAFMALLLVSVCLADTLDENHPNVRAAMALQNQITSGVMTWPGVIGTAVGLNSAEQADIVVYVDRTGPVHPQMIQAVLLQFLFVPVRTELSD